MTMTPSELETRIVDFANEVLLRAQHEHTRTGELIRHALCEWAMEDAHRLFVLRNTLTK